MSWLMETAHLCIAGIKLPRRTVALRTSGDNWRCNASFPTRMELIVSAFVLDQLQLSVSDANTLASVYICEQKPHTPQSISSKDESTGAVSIRKPPN
jgi:hypothetical protein